MRIYHSRRYIFLVFMFFFTKTNTFSQKQGKALIDSLEKRLKNYSPACKSLCLQDSTKVNLLIDLAYEYNFNKPDTVLILCNEAVGLSKNINYQVGIAQSYHVIGIFYKGQDDYPNALKFFFDEVSVLDKLLSNNKNSKILLSKKAACFNSLANLYKLKGDDQNALYYYQSALKVNKEYDNEEGIVINNTNMGDIYFNRGDFPKSLEFYYSALRLADKLVKEKITAAIFGRIGRVYRTQSDLAKALDFYSRAITINKKLIDKNGMAVNYQSLALLYADQKNMVKVVEYNNLALQLYTEMKDKKGIAAIYNNTGTVYKDKAELFEKNEEKDSAKSNYSIALSYFLQACKIQENLAQNLNMADYVGNLGSTYVALQNYEKGEKYLRQSQLLSDSLQYLHGASWSNNELSNFYLMMGNHKQALQHYKKAVAAKDSIFNESKTQDITRLEMNYEFDKKEAITKAEFEKQTAIAEAEKQTAITQADKRRIMAETEKLLQVSEADKKRIQAETDKKQISQVMAQKEMSTAFERMEAKQKIKLANAETLLQKQKALRFSVIGGAVLIILASVFGFLFYKKNAEQKQKEISLNLQVSETEMKALRSQMNPHFIFNALQSIQTFLLSHKSEEANLYLLKFSKLMRLVLENSQHREVSLKEDMLALELYMQLESIRLPNPFTYQFHIDDSIDIDNDNIPPLILQPFVENAIWHGLQHKNEPGHINIYIRKNTNALYTIVEDNGIGRDMSKQAAQPMLLKKESLGMKLTEDRLKIMNELKKIKARFSITDIFTDENKPAGTKVELSLPLAS